MRTRRVPARPSMVLRMTGASPATNPIIVMVSALRPKMTRKSGYISTVGADAMAAIQVSVASRSSLTRCSNTPALTPTMVMSTMAQNASFMVWKKRLGTSSSTITRLKLAPISDGIGTMNRLITPMRMRISTSSRTATSPPMPSTAGPNRALAMAAVVMAGALPPATRAIHRHACPGSPPRAGRPRSARHSGRTLRSTRSRMCADGAN